MGFFGKRQIFGMLETAYEKHKNNNYQEEIILLNRFADLPKDRVNTVDKLSRISHFNLDTAINESFDRAVNEKMGFNNLDRAGKNLEDMLDGLGDKLEGKKNDGIVRLGRRPYCAYRIILKLDSQYFNTEKGEGSFKIYNMDGYKVFSVMSTRSLIGQAHSVFVDSYTGYAGELRQTNGGLLSGAAIKISVGTHRNGIIN